MTVNSSSVSSIIETIEQDLAIPEPVRQRLNWLRWQDWLFEKTTLVFALAVLLSLTAIMIALTIGAWPAFREFGLGFITSTEWNPVTDRYGALNAIYGTLVTSFIALLIGVPVSFGIALFLTELCPRWLKRPLGTAVELLAAVPSIIYGMWGLFVFAPVFGDVIQPALQQTLGRLPLLGQLFQGAGVGIGMLAAGIILAIMVIPFIASVMRDVFDVVPAVLKESAYALGATTWEVARHIVLPYTKIGVVGGIMLGLGRALGETMAV
ncbi:MAG: phosphate ABC transporter permease subunit PstC, partial [Pseudomonas sp.]